MRDLNLIMGTAQYQPIPLADLVSQKSNELPVTEVSIDEVLLDDTSNCRKITGSVPKLAYLICVIEFSERLSYYLIQGCITNMVERKLPHGSTNGAVVDDPHHSNESPGALGLGLPLATFLMQLLTLTANISPLLTGYLADTRLGRFKTVSIGAVVGFFGHIMLVLAAIPPVLKHVYVSLAVTTVSLLTIAFSAACIKPNLMPLLMDQYTPQSDYKKTLASGEVVIVGRQATLERMTLVYYLFINFGCFLAFIGSFIERRYGFWVVFFVTSIVYLSLLPLLKYLQPRLKNAAPSGRSILLDVAPLLKQCFSPGWIRRILNGTFWPANGPEQADGITMSDLRTTVQNCSIFLYFILFYVNDNALTPVQINQAASMTTNGFPNDLFQSFNPVGIIITIPFQDYILYPLLRKKRIPFTSVDKIVVGLVLAGVGSLFGAYLQYLIYTTDKCGYHASTCDEVSPVSAWWGSIMFALQAAGECFAVVTCYEMAYSRSPNCMRSFVISLFLSSLSLSSVVGEILSYWAHDPYLIGIFGWPGGLCVLSAAAFYYQFRGLRAVELALP